jgi:hypothetical protein
MRVVRVLWVEACSGVGVVACRCFPAREGDACLHDAKLSSQSLAVGPSGFRLAATGRAKVLSLACGAKGGDSARLRVQCPALSSKLSVRRSLWIQGRLGEFSFDDSKVALYPIFGSGPGMEQGRWQNGKDKNS